MFKGAPVGSRDLLSAPEARRADTPPMAACMEGAGLDEDFKQLSDEAPSEGLTTIPEHEGQGVNLCSVQDGVQSAIVQYASVKLTWWVALVEAGRHLRQGVPP